MEQDTKVIPFAEICKGLEIKPVDNRNYISESNGYRRLKMTDSQKMQVGALVGQLPALGVTEALSNTTLYSLEFPAGVEGTLMNLKRGGQTGILQGADGKITGVASLHATDTLAMARVVQAFQIMSLVTNQYYLSQINSKLDKISQSIEAILGFLYGDKKAELLAEISFTKYAYQNYISICEHDEQRIATIGSLQQSKKIAMKDIEFYMNDLDALIGGRDSTKINTLMENAFGIEESLNLSIQLYVMSSLLEVYYSGNLDKNYISNLETEMSAYIAKCDKQMLGSFSVLEAYVQAYKAKPMVKFDKEHWQERIGSIVESLKGGEESKIKRYIHATLHSFEKRNEYCVDTDGNLYFKTA